MERLGTLGQDLTLALRALRSRPGWTAIVLLTLALGVGANSALFTVVNAALLRPLPYPQPDRVLSLSEAGTNGDLLEVTDRTYSAWRSARSFESVAAFGFTRLTMSGAPGQPALFVDGQLATPTYFTVLGVRPALGRTFMEEEARQGAPPVIVISDQLWHRRFGGDRSIVGQLVMIDDTPTRVVGVMPRSFTSAHGAQFWTPLYVNPAPAPEVTFYYSMIGRLAPGASLSRARDELRAIDARSSARAPADEHTVPVVMTLHDRRYGDARPSLLLLSGSVAVLLLIACANIVSLMLVRAARHQREFAIRLAIGASRWRVVRYLLCESAILSLGGGALGLIVPIVSLRPMVRMAPPTVANVEGIVVDGHVLLFTLAVAGLTGLLVGLVPAMEIGRGSLSAMLSNGGGRVANVRQRGVRQVLIVAELATALVLLTGAGLLTRSFMRVLAIDPGFRPTRLVDVQMELPPAQRQSTSPAPLFSLILERARNLPGVDAAALTDAPPLSGASSSYTFPLDGGQSPILDLSVVTPNYFATIGARVTSGRALTMSDDRGAPRAAVVNQSLARSLYGNGRAIGQRLRLPDRAGSGAVIVGIVNDMPRDELEEGAHPTVYLPFAQAGADDPVMHLIVRTRGESSSIVRSVREIVRDVDPSMPAPHFTTMEHVVSAAVAPRRFSFVLLGTFAALAALLAAVGLYGVIASLVADRTREIGIRVALGADQSNVVRLVVAQGVRLLLPGLAFGFLASLAAVRLLRTMLFEVQVYDPWTFVAAVLTLSVVAVGASYVPAMRAASIDPLLALRAES